jgi:hypothetical protein
MHCYCSNLLETYGKGALEVLFEGSDQHCADWYWVFVVEKYLTWILAGFVAIVNLVLQVTVDAVGKHLYKPTNTTEGNRFRIMTIFLSQYINTAIIVLLAYNSFVFSKEKISENNPKYFLIGAFDEFNARWYLQIGSPLIMTIVFQILTPHFGMLIHALWMGSIRCADRRCSLNKAVTKRVIQSDYEDLYTGPEFILQVRYA